MKKNPDINVPQKTHVPVVSVLLAILGTTFGAFGISQIMGVFTSFSNAIITYITQSMEWDSTWSGLVIGITFLILSALSFRSSSKFKELSNRVKNVFSSSITNQPSNFYNLKVVPMEYLVNHFVTYRGCNTIEDPDGRGFGIYCPDYPTDDNMKRIINGDAEKFSTGTKIATIIFLNIIVILPPFMIRDGTMDLVYGPWVWYTFLIIAILVFYESMILPLWSLVIMYCIHIVIVMIVSPEILDIVKVAIPIAIIFFGLSLIMYMFRYDHCKKETNWWCDRM